MITLLAITRLMACRPALAANVEAVLGNGSAALQALERTTVEYLVAEQQLGRISAGAHTEPLALAELDDSPIDRTCGHPEHNQPDEHPQGLADQDAGRDTRSRPGRHSAAPATDRPIPRNI
ncbi:hypothetical protein [Dactylosporangium sp. NPDC051484]|uniref:hypothetical protein n=1 Tax=Dactylosporangium sp. NPDC051484 TaxID=3154942 RepID=UPI003450B032